MLRVLSIFIAMALWASSAVLSPVLAAGKRVALVIGNASYADVGSLANPSADAAALAQAFRTAEFDEVRHVTDLSAEAMRQELKSFSALSASAEVAVIYYAGHGVEVADQNYLVPVDAKLLRVSDIEFEAISLDAVRGAVSGATKLRMVVLDACRNNPFKLQGKGFTRAATRGLGKIEPNAGEVVAYAAKEGTLAQDGPASANSPFATALIKSLKQPGLEIRLLLGQVRDDVLAATANEQEPYTYASLGGEAIYLSPPQNQNPALAAEEWKLVSASSSIAVLEAFRDKYRHDAVYQTLAQERLGMLTKPASFKDCDDCPEMVHIPKGQFMMGSPDTERHHQPDESPQHLVHINRSLSVGKFEVTVQQYQAFLKATGHDAGKACSVWNGKRFLPKAGHDVSDPGFAQSGKHPATCVSWRDAKAYVTWLSGKTGFDYRLLSEAEWEYTARAGVTAAYGSGVAPDRNTSNFASTSPEAVGQYAANAFDLHDMQGNVWEWTEDCYHKTYDTTPNDGSAAASKPGCTRMYRGGGWFNQDKDLRFATRGGNSADLRVNIFGLRVAREMK
jgi:formylglycine-generating enzyme required for sulfatase activity